MKKKKRARLFVVFALSLWFEHIRPRRLMPWHESYTHDRSMSVCLHEFLSISVSLYRTHARLLPLFFASIPFIQLFGCLDIIQYTRTPLQIAPICGFAIQWYFYYCAALIVENCFGCSEHYGYVCVSVCVYLFVYIYTASCARTLYIYCIYWRCFACAQHTTRANSNGKTNKAEYD